MLSAYLLFPHYAQCLPIIPALCSVLTYYSRIMLNAFWYLLFSKLCQHNPPNPNRWFRVFRGKYFRGLNTSTGNETSMHFTQSTSTRRLGTILGHFSRIATKTRNLRKFSTAKISRYTVFDKTHSMFDFRIRYSIKRIRYSMSAFDVRCPHSMFDLRI